MNRYVGSILLVAALAPSVSAAHESAAETIRGRVASVSEFPVPRSGVIITWVALELAQDNVDGRRQLLMPFLSEDQPQPKVGEYCVFTVHVAEAGGFIGRKVVPQYKATLIDTFDCGPGGSHGKT
ncbi:hypothetical protein FIV34_11515 [Luteibacter pinisoli]|uniref:Uncharacterized protein n=1 Tax=Luteibacter pinisoli TaxID=2589080 RepID=A0A4Y5Z5F1_9GAMM|nr:hypothetical protein [Luteibacter pinisoli]QDE39789.1 hypothetical protein FIV34_11515 [Luteibacter pinisoli]